MEHSPNITCPLAHHFWIQLLLGATQRHSEGLQDHHCTMSLDHCTHTQYNVYILSKWQSKYGISYNICFTILFKAPPPSLQKEENMRRVVGVSRVFKCCLLVQQPYWFNNHKTFSNKCNAGQVDKCNYILPCFNIHIIKSSLTTKHYRTS